MINGSYNAAVVGRAEQSLEQAPEPRTEPAPEALRIVRRPALVAQIAASDTTVLAAGAGYGKTTITEQLRSSARVPTAFAPLSTADHNPAVFVSSLRRAVRAAGLSDLAAVMSGSEPADAIEQLLAASPQAS